MKPKVKFKLNKALDKKMVLEFLDVERGGVDFSRGVTNVHPRLKRIKDIKNKNKRKQLINEYFDFFYKKHGSYLKKRTIEFDQEWQEVESKFLKETKKIFKGHTFPKGKYIGYLSIIDCNPRFLKDKTFQVFYFHPKGVRYVTAHELLHFIFYNYAVKKYPDTFKKLDPDKGLFWDLAELFNAVVLHTPGLVKVHGQKKKLYYPNHKKHIAHLVRLWNKEKDIDKWLQASLIYLRSNNHILI